MQPATVSKLNMCLHHDQGKAEERRAMAVAREQEMKALIVGNRPKAVLAAADVPKPLAQAFNEGSIRT